jgi:hypothetical protein
LKDQGPICLNLSTDGGFLLTRRLISIDLRFGRRFDDPSSNERIGANDLQSVELTLAMKSHTVPEKLLKQFAFEHPVKGLRLWRYQKSREPYRDVSPSKATVVEGQFFDPRNAKREERIETELNHRFENPVHDFIEQLGYRAFVFGANHTVALAPYIALLWHRSKARKRVTRLHRDLSIETFEKLKKRNDLLERIAASWTHDKIRHGRSLSEPVGVGKVIEAIDRFIGRFNSPGHDETSYADTMERVMEGEDTTFDGARWRIFHTEPEDPFVIGDAPVVTWRRDQQGVAQYGIGFREPNVEVLLPVSPTACLHVLPNVQRTRTIITPPASEVNAAEAAFAEACYANLGSSSLNQHLQGYFGRAEIGINAFSVAHKDYVTLFCKHLIVGGVPPNV